MDGWTVPIKNIWVFAVLKNKQKKLWIEAENFQKRSNKCVLLYYMSHPFLAIFYSALPSLSVSHQRFVGALEDVTNKVAAPSFHCLPANEAKVIHMTNTLERKDQVA